MPAVSINTVLTAKQHCVRTPTWIARSVSYLTASPLSRTLLHHCDMSCAESRRLGVMVDRHLKGKTVNKTGQMSRKQSQHSLRKIKKKFLFLHEGVSIDFWHQESKRHIKLPQPFNHSTRGTGAGLPSQSAKCSGHLSCSGRSVSLIL